MRTITIKIKLNDEAEKLYSDANPAWIAASSLHMAVSMRHEIKGLTISIESDKDDE